MNKRNKYLFDNKTLKVENKARKKVGNVGTVGILQKVVGKFPTQ